MANKRDVPSIPVAERLALSGAVSTEPHVWRDALIDVGALVGAAAIGLLLFWAVISWP